MSATNGAKGTLQEGKEFLYAMVQLKTRQLKLVGYFAHILVGGGEEIHAAFEQ